jgi:phage terminase large subunit
MPSLKGKNSVIEGIELLKGYRIVVHPRCEETINELSFYSYATDKDSGKVLPELEKNQADHCIDALRYACEGFKNLRREEPRPLRLVDTFGNWNAV